MNKAAGGVAAPKAAWGGRWRRVWWGLSIVGLLAIGWAGHVWSDRLWIEAHAAATAELIARDGVGPVVVVAGSTWQATVARAASTWAPMVALVVAFVPLLRRLGARQCGFARGYLAQSAAEADR